jgi:predicted TPR repeat methyltransferase
MLSETAREAKMGERTGYLDRIYRQDAAGAAKLYREWAPSYDAELTEGGYATPQRIAAALADAGAPRDAPVLDFGCGTGLSGQALAAAGFAAIDGWDAGAEMLEQARAKGVYRDLTLIDPAQPMPQARYAAIGAAGVIAPSHAPPETLPALAERLAPGGVLAFSFNEGALNDPGYMGAAQALIDDPAFTLRDRTSGVHIARLGSTSDVFVLGRKR